MRTLRNISSSRIGELAIAGLAFAFSMRAGMDRICDQGAGPMVSGGHDEADGAAKVNMGQTLIMTSECCVEACESWHSIVFWIVYA